MVWGACRCVRATLPTREAPSTAARYGGSLQTKWWPDRSPPPPHTRHARALWLLLSVALAHSVVEAEEAGESSCRCRGIVYRDDARYREPDPNCPAGACSYCDSYGGIVTNSGIIGYDGGGHGDDPTFYTNSDPTCRYSCSGSGRRSSDMWSFGCWPAQVVTAMRAAPTDLHVQSNGCDALISGQWHRADGPDGAHHDPGEVEVATAALGRFPDSAALLKSCQRVVDRARGNCDGSGGIVHIDPYTCVERLGQPASGELTEVTVCSRDERYKNVGLNDDPTCHGACFSCVAAQVVAAMKAAPTESAVQLNGCRALIVNNLTSSGHNASGVRLATEAAQAALARFPADDNVQKSCQSALVIMDPCASFGCAHGSCKPVDLCDPREVTPGNSPRAWCGGHLDVRQLTAEGFTDIQSNLAYRGNEVVCTCDSPLWSQNGSEYDPCDTRSLVFWVALVPLMLVGFSCTAIGCNLMKQRWTNRRGQASMRQGLLEPSSIELGSVSTTPDALVRNSQPGNNPSSNSKRTLDRVIDSRNST